MSTDLKREKAKAFPSILSKLKMMQNSSDQRTSKDSSAGVRSRAPSRMDSQEDGSRVHGESRVTPRTAWASSRRDSSISSISSTAGVPMDGSSNSKVGLFSRIPSMLSLGGSNTAWGKRMKKKRAAEEYAAAKLQRQKEDMIAFYKGTPLVDDRATSQEILKFLYEIWEPQLCSSYRKDAKISTTCRQDMRSAKRIAQTTPRRLVKLHRARVVINACAPIPPPAGGSRPSSCPRPHSAKSVT